MNMGRFALRMPVLAGLLGFGFLLAGSGPAAGDSKLPIGQPCKIAGDCQSGICGAWDAGKKACLPPDKSSPVTGPCATSAHCQDAAAMCVKHQCTLPLKLGEPCLANGECKSAFCDRGLGSGGTGKCVPAAGTGQTNDYCSQEAHCKTKLCTNNKCEAKHPAGGVCRYNESCTTGFCELTTVTPSGAANQAINQAVNAWFKCVPQAGQGTKGQYCTNHNQCAANQCISSACLAKSSLGGPCAGGGNKQCASGYCDAGSGSGNTNKCVPKNGSGTTGDYCSKPSHCATNLCENKKCAAKRGLGVACPQGNSQCQSQYCDAGMGSGGTNKCVPPAGKGKTGDYCSQNGHCKPGKSCKAHKCG
jgi:hypothetical protein